MKYFHYLKSILILVLAILMAGCRPSFFHHHSSKPPIVCFGASLTLGKGADKGHDYPSLLRAMVKVPVINAGIKGNTTRDELNRLQHDVLELNPQMVIITQRAGDLSCGIPKEQTIKNLEMMIDRIQSQKAVVVLVTFEPDNLEENYFKDFRDLARDKHVVLVADVINDVETNPQYMHDRVHPNNEGYRLVAQRVYEHIKPFLK